MMPVAILCGGLATRMYPVTRTLPKSLVEVAGEPFIFRQLRLLARNGIRDVVLCAGNMGEMIREKVGDGGQFAMRVGYSFDGDQLLGTAGALKKALSLLPDAFFVLYGDSYLECDYRAVASAFALSEKRMPALMTVFENKNQFDSSNVVFRDGRIVRYDKKTCAGEMMYIDYGLSIVRDEALATVSLAQKTDLGDIFFNLAREGELMGFEVRNRFYEIGSQSGLAELERHIHATSEE